MKLISYVSIGMSVFLLGCQATGLVTPLEKGYIAEATNNGDEKAANRVALKTAEDKCKSLGKDFYVIEQVKEKNNSYDLSDTEADITNIASQILLGTTAIDKERTVKLHFDCR